MAEKKKLLMYANYYYPDLASVGQLLRELAEGMKSEFDITVICVVPSYTGVIDEKYKTKKRFYRDEVNGVTVLRIRVSEFDKTNKKSRIKNALEYFVGAIIATFMTGRQDYIFATSQPPILGGLLGVWGKWLKHAKYIYNIQDFNPEQTIVVGYSGSKFILKLMMCLDKFSCKRSNVVITVGRDLVDTLNNRFKGKHVPKCILINNWIDETEVYPLPMNHPEVMAFRNRYDLSGKHVFMYSGNIGLFYDLENLIKVIELFGPGTKTADGREVIFAFVGAGSILDKLVQYKEEKGMTNVLFIPYQDKESLNYSLNAGDIHWCVNAQGIKGVSCPSKYYGIAAVAKPVLGVLESGSEIRLLIEKTGGGLCVEPGDYESIAKSINWFITNVGTGKIVEMGSSARQYIEQNLSKNRSLERYIKEILDVK